MSGTMSVELVGGPLDGEFLEMESWRREYRIAMRDVPERWTCDAENYPAKLFEALFSIGVYESRGNPRVMHWAGDAQENRAAYKKRIEGEERALLAKLKAKYEGDLPSSPPSGAPTE